jgi:polysaccharide biosynthesis transport protein
VAEREDEKFTLVDTILGFLNRRRWWILAPSCGVALIAMIVVLQLPNRYTSEATLVATQPQISQRYVESGAQQPVVDTVNAMTYEVLSRTRLITIINELNLYPTAPGEQAPPPEVLVAKMLKEVHIEPLDTGPTGNFSTFKISFRATNPDVAQRVTSMLTLFFAEESRQRQGNQAKNTTEFLTDQVERAKRRLDEQEARLQAFKRRNLGELPEQQGVNIAALTELRIQLQTTTGTLRQAEQQKAALEAELRGSLTRLNDERSALLDKFTTKHSSVIKKDADIARTRSLLSWLLGETRRQAPPQGVNPSDPSFAQLEHRVETNANDLANLTKEETRLRSEIDRIQARLSRTPVRDTELAEIQRDYESYKRNYTELLNKQNESQMTVSVEQRQEGRQFRIVDPPSLPMVPSSPKRLLLSAAGIGTGLLFGFALAFVREMRDRTFHTVADLSKQITVPLILGMPLLPTARESRNRKWKIAVQWLAASSLMLAVVAVEFYIYRHD